MLFTLLPPRSSVPSPKPKATRAYLVRDNWDDYSFVTLFELHLVVDGQLHSIGNVKIGQFGIAPAMIDGEFRKGRPELEAQFETLDDRFFSLGQGEDYYATLNDLRDGVREQVLGALRDVARDPDLFDRAKNEESMRISLLRTLTPETVRGRLHRLAIGNAKLTPYHLSFELPAPRGHGRGGPVRLTFSVEPDSNPPSNVHVLIGRNGVGKTSCLAGMTRALARARPGERAIGAFDFGASGGTFANLVSVAFSAFDPFDPPETSKELFPYTYIGLQALDEKDKQHRRGRPKSVDDLAQEFAGSAARCRATSSKLARWRRALMTLSSDPLFAEADVGSLCSDEPPDDFETRTAALYAGLSSGHKIVLLTVTRLVETVEERTLVLVDEPEAHLHPPLLSALTRSLSDLVVHRNAMAVIATHSPVVLQEVPRSCTWILQRFGREVTAQRPSVETFGENLGTLTSEVFGLEVTRAGFHRLLEHAVAELRDYDAVLERFDGQLGAEARAIVRTLVASKSIGN